MTLRAVMIGVLAETPIHPGTGQSGGTIDLPVAREGGTDYPFVPGSSNKGSTKSRVVGRDKSTSKYFAELDDQGRVIGQGSMMIGDLRLLLLPLRSSHGAYKWATCPHLLERFARDLERAGYADRLPKLSVEAGKVETVVRSDKDIGKPLLLLEELTFRIQNPIASDSLLIKTITRLIPSEDPYARTQQRLTKQLLVMSDDDFAWFARYGLPVHAHNVLREGTKTSKNLWYEETLPADTLLYSMIAPRVGATDAESELKPVLDSICARKWFQFGGNETTGQGICRLHVVAETAVP